MGSLEASSEELSDVRAVRAQAHAHEERVGDVAKVLPAPRHAHLHLDRAQRLPVHVRLRGPKPQLQRLLARPEFPPRRLLHRFSLLLLQGMRFASSACVSLLLLFSFPSSFSFRSRRWR